MGFVLLDLEAAALEGHVPVVAQVAEECELAAAAAGHCWFALQRYWTQWNLYEDDWAQAGSLLKLASVPGKADC
jgi:hypothetical protein